MTHRVIRSILILTCVAVAPVQAQRLAIAPAHHALGESIAVEYRLPAGASALAPVPACAIVHGSGGLLRENAAGAVCGPDLEPNFAAVADQLTALGVAVVMPDSFSSRDPRFCEDNEDAFLQFAPAPFFNDGDGAKVRDEGYDRRRTVIRVLDLLATQSWLCGQAEIDCSRTCLIGASNGGTAVLAYAAQDLGRHLREYLDLQSQRRFESSSGFAGRTLALQHFPATTLDVSVQAGQRALPQFIQAVSPGCRMRDLVPTVRASHAMFDPAQHLGDLYYPQDPIALHLEIGSTDSVPDECHGSGIRQQQVFDYESLVSVVPSRYQPMIYPGEGHDLLADIPAQLDARRQDWVMQYFFPAIFADGFEAP